MPSFGFATDLNRSRRTRGATAKKDKMRNTWAEIAQTGNLVNLPEVLQNAWVLRNSNCQFAIRPRRENVYGKETVIMWMANDVTIESFELSKITAENRSTGST